jgi:Ca2+-binding RTX toxin-like protein
MQDNARGGNDALTGGTGGSNALYGDALELSNNAGGGNDTLIGGAGATNTLYGDGQSMADNTTGGNDTLIGGAGPGAFNALRGDADFMSGNAQGGNDTLIGGDGAPTNYVFGDAFEMDGNARGGNDTLISGTGTDYMWGDAESINGVSASPTAPTGTVATGADTFVFAPGNGNDSIYDFRQSDGDRIDVSAYKFQSLTEMMITFDGTNTKIGFDANDSVTLVGFADPSALRPSDFILA